MCFPSKPPCGFADAWHLPQIRPPKVQAPTPQWPQREQAQHGGFEKTKSCVSIPRILGIFYGVEARISFWMLGFGWLWSWFQCIWPTKNGMSRKNHMGNRNGLILPYTSMLIANIWDHLRFNQLITLYILGIYGNIIYQWRMMWGLIFKTINGSTMKWRLKSCTNVVLLGNIMRLWHTVRHQSLVAPHGDERRKGHPGVYCW